MQNPCFFKAKYPTWYRLVEFCGHLGVIFGLLVLIVVAYIGYVVEPLLLLALLLPPIPPAIIVPISVGMFFTDGLPETIHFNCGCQHDY